MKLARLTLTNFGAFEGSHEIAFGATSAKSKKNITLVGGKNGAGKTSILQAIRLCLYGPGALGMRTAEKAYLKYLNGQINNNARKNPDSKAQVRLEFDFVLDGAVSHFDVERQWQAVPKADRIRESLVVRKDGRELDELERNQWQNFINELIPRGIADFFFFDAEQIEKLIEDETTDLQLRESIHALLSLDLLRRLGEDLDSLESKLIRRNKDVAPRLLAITEREEALKLTESTARTQVEDKKARVHSLEVRVKELEQTIFVEGKSLYEISGKLKQKKAQLEKDLRSLRGEASDIVGEFLPFAIARRVTDGLLSQLKDEQASQKWDDTRKTIKELLPNVVAQISGKKEGKQQQDLKVHQKAWESTFKSMKKRLSERKLHGLNESDADAITRHIHDARKVAVTRLKIIETEKLKAYGEMKRINDRMRRIDRSAVTPSMEREYAESKAELAKEMSGLHLFKEALGNALRELEKLHKEKETTAADQAVLTADDYKLSMGGKVSKVIDRFFEILFAKKLEELAKTTTKIYSELARKKGFIRAITFSHESLRVELIDRDGNQVPKAALSAGEKQMLAVSILWALGRVSGRKLPIVIDTPLARLDSDHRESFVLRYLPKASHQVIVLSTDTEIDRQYSQKLKSKVAANYLLDYDVKKGATRVIPGYFFGGVN